MSTRAAKARSATPGAARSLDERAPAAGDHERPAARGERIGVRKTYKLYIGGAVPAHRVGPRVRGLRRRRASSSPTPAAGTRKDIRDAVRAARRRSPAGRRKTAYNRSPDPVSHRRADGGAPRPVRGRGDGAPRGVSRARAGRTRRRRDRPLGLVRRLGGQVPAADRHGQPGRRPLLQLQRAGADRRRRRHRAGGVVRCSGS